MAAKLSDLSVAELRRRYGDAGSRVSQRVLSQLRRDPRKGVQQFYRTLRRREDRRRHDARRLEGLLHFERVLWKTGLQRVAGVDEAGVGPLAGPVVAAAVIFPPGFDPADTALQGVDDSKRLDAASRESLAAAIRTHASTTSVGLASVAEIDRLNVYQAGLLAMRRAVEGLAEVPQHLLVDARQVPGVPMPQNPFEKGDGLNFSIAAASILAKTHRDGLMLELDRRHPEYGFARHKGYSTPEHMAAVRQHGPCPVHRLSYPVLAELCGKFSDHFYALRARLESATEHGALERVESAVDAAADDLPEAEAAKLRRMLRRAWERS